jgi:cytochrome P450 family 9
LSPLLSCIHKTEWDDDDLAAQVVLFFLAGFETASTLLCFATHQLATHPDVQSRLQEEIDMTLIKDGGNLTYEAVQGMKYLDMVVSGMVQKNQLLYCT